MMPGRTLHRLATHLCSTKTLERVVEPAIADLQKEYAAERGAGSRAWVLLRGYGAILKVIVICALSVSSTTHDERQALARTLAWSVGSMAATSALLTLPLLLNSEMRSWAAAMTLVPQALPLAIPIGIAVGIAFGVSARPAMNIVKVTLLGGVVASALSFAVLAWAMPGANDAFRNIAVRELRASGYQGEISGPQKGHTDMTLSELRHEEAAFAAAGRPQRARQFTFSLHLRFALAVATLALAGVLLAAPFTHRGLRGFVAFAACFLYWALLYTGEALSVPRTALPPSAAAWLPNIVLGAIAIVVASSRSSRLRDFQSTPR